MIMANTTDVMKELLLTQLRSMHLLNVCNKRDVSRSGGSKISDCQASKESRVTM